MGLGWTEEDHQRFLWDDLARSADHAAIVVNGARVGILQVVESDECITLGQIELLPDAQGRGVGTAVVRWLQDRAGDRLPIALAVDPWALLAYSGGSPVTVVAEWEAGALTPMSVTTPESSHDRERMVVL